MERIYALIKEERLKQGMTQTDLAIAVGYKGKSMIAKVEKGLVDLPLPMVTKFADALHVSESYLMGWEDEPTDFKADLTQAYIKGQQVSKIMNNKEVFECASKLLELPPELQAEAFNYVEYLLNRHLLSRAQRQED